ncbi:hypothetical protein BaRGS_00038669, partial [Batillaria attramentaria]
VFVESCAPAEFSILGCKAGWYGSVCDRQCSDKCLPGNTGIITCQQNDGRCTTGCTSGWRGPTCTLPCAMNCDGGCDQYDGTCRECKSGYYGVESCEECGYCRDDDVCNNTNGHCPRGCRDNYDGDRCDTEFSDEDTQVRVDTEGLQTETSDADTHYESLEKYENPDDIKPYSTLEPSHGRRTNVNIQGDKEAVLYHNITSYKTQ